MRLERMRGPHGERGFQILEQRPGAPRGVKDLLGFLTMKHDDGPAVGYIKVMEGHQRHGLATKLYEAAAREACRVFGQPLRSDVERSAYAQAFWEKQEKKGRATCERRMPKGARVAKDLSTMGRGGCYRYVLTCPAPASLARAR